MCMLINGRPPWYHLNNAFIRADLKPTSQPAKTFGSQAERSNKRSNTKEKLDEAAATTSSSFLGFFVENWRQKFRHMISHLLLVITSLHRYKMLIYALLYNRMGLNFVYGAHRI